MEQAKKEHLESKGWKIGTVSDFLELTPVPLFPIQTHTAIPKSDGCRKLVQIHYLYCPLECVLYLSLRPGSKTVKIL